MNRRAKQLLTAAAFIAASLAAQAERITDFKDPAQFSRWAAYSDQVIPGGASIAQVERRVEGDKALLRVFGELKPGFIYPYAGVQMALGAAGKTNDWTAYKGLRFKARGDGKVYRVNVVLAKVRDHDEHGYFFKAGPDWQTVEVPFTELKQSGFGRRIAWDPKQVTHIGFQAGGGVMAYGLDLHDVELY